MDANSIISDNMTLEEKLLAIEKAMQATQAEFNEANGRAPDAPVDPALLTVCDGCE